MKGQINSFLAGGFLALALFGATAAGPLEEGKAADKRRDFSTELQILRPLADQGNAAAQNALGMIYAHKAAALRMLLQVNRRFPEPRVAGPRSE